MAERLRKSKKKVGPFSTSDNWTGRCCRVGQHKPTRFFVIWVEGEPHDQAPRDANKLRIKEAEALTRMAPQRLQKRGDKRNRDDRNEDFALD